jgi:microcompartment protein CcmL/EutN
MIKVRNGNVILEVEGDEDNVQRYLDKGFSIVDPVTEQVIKEAIPNTVNELKVLVIKQKNRIAELEAELSELKNSDEEEKPKKRTRKAK